MRQNDHLNPLLPSFLPHYVIHWSTPNSTQSIYSSDSIYYLFPSSTHPYPIDAITRHPRDPLLWRSHTTQSIDNLPTTTTTSISFITYRRLRASIPLTDNRKAFIYTTGPINSLSITTSKLLNPLIVAILLPLVLCWSPPVAHHTSPTFDWLAFFSQINREATALTLPLFLNKEQTYKWGDNRGAISTDKVPEPYTCCVTIAVGRRYRSELGPWRQLLNCLQENAVTGRVLMTDCS